LGYPIKIRGQQRVATGLWEVQALHPYMRDVEYYTLLKLISTSLGGTDSGYITHFLLGPISG